MQSSEEKHAFKAKGTAKAKAIMWEQARPWCRASGGNELVLWSREKKCMVGKPMAKVRPKQNCEIENVFKGFLPFFDLHTISFSIGTFLASFNP